ncbi:urease accessory protein UreD [Cryobacterium psychrophilum]|uniref:Urease accessory protein n=1 Tax=Cryobacterium psychrophilum TaxID=41988 RepID=A0A4Y8KL44_9MICO|nr:urease accessory protein UreD [Cryobacterium psychrophilum]TDW28839.1 urease accessory protein [Cryobacterium psychrophilum]TFD76191.1 urease accessory protein [Cryobacterium psychrophilum]
MTGSAPSGATPAATSIHLVAAPLRARLHLTTGALVPRTVDIGPNFARVALIAAGALLLGDDHVHIDVVVGAGCVLELEDVGGTVAYDADGEPSTWTVTIRVEAHALLLWHGLPFIVADGSHVTRHTRIDLVAASSAVCLRETIVFGRSAEQGGFVDLRTHVSVNAEPLFLEWLPVRGVDHSPGILGNNRILDTILLAGLRSEGTHPTGLTAGDVAQTSDGEVLQLEGVGSLARSLQVEAHRSPLPAVWDTWRALALSSWERHPMLD